ncbi:nitrite reductase small subunit NirD [Streptacidiphilus carbonis]|jgi:nitrite reductase (NADH) small subunit|uniref:nitrite reductase small subunit NirD n=1 Tax=Streptacidiphilus carbonis TaxID=105422 RepID=UPI000A0694C2|nr:nitrite reductase small subunit NirD [Streptacidiphilus carbonis]
MTELLALETVALESVAVDRDTPVRTAVELHDGESWVQVCELDDLLPGRGVAVLLGAEQVALFRDPADGLHALDNRDPFSGAQVLSRGLIGNRGAVQVVVSPMLKQAFALETGDCLDEDTAPDGSSANLRRWPVRSRPSHAPGDGVREP